MQRKDIVISMSVQYKELTYKLCESNRGDFINVQISEKPKGRRYLSEFKNECIKMYFAGPKLNKNKLVNLCCLPTAQPY